MTPGKFRTGPSIGRIVHRQLELERGVEPQNRNSWAVTRFEAAAQFQTENTNYQHPRIHYEIPYTLKYSPVHSFSYTTDYLKHIKVHLELAQNDEFLG